MSEQMREDFERWAQTNINTFLFSDKDAVAWEAWQAALSARPQQSDEPVAEIIECKVMGGQTVREIEGRWKFLRAGTKLYVQAALATQPQAPQGAVTDAERYRWLRENDHDRATIRELQEAIACNALKDFDDVIDRLRAAPETPEGGKP